MDEITLKRWRAMMTDLYNFGMKWFVIPKERMNDDAMWEEFVKDQEDFVATHDREDDRFAVKLMALFGDHSEDQELGLAVLCDSRMSRNTAALIQYYRDNFGGAPNETKT
jgi:hypothetical protein